MDGEHAATEEGAAASPSSQQQRSSAAQLHQQVEVDEDDVLQRTLVEEAQEITSIVASVVQSQGDAATQSLQRWKAIVSARSVEAVLQDHGACNPRA